MRNRTVRNTTRMSDPASAAFVTLMCLVSQHDGASLSARSRRGLAARPARPRPPSLSSACLGPDRFRSCPPLPAFAPGPARGAERDRGTGRGRPRRPAGESESAACSAMGGRACVLRPDRASHSHRPPRARRAQPRGTGNHAGNGPAPAAGRISSDHVRRRNTIRFSGRSGLARDFRRADPHRCGSPHTRAGAHSASNHAMRHHGARLTSTTTC